MRIELAGLVLPHRFEIVATRDFHATAAAIHDMIVRGAGAIGATAAYGLAQGGRAFRGSDLKKFSQHVAVVYETLKAARPTAVDPVNAMDQVRRAMSAGKTFGAITVHRHVSISVVIGAAKGGRFLAQAAAANE